MHFRKKKYFPTKRQIITDKNIQFETYLLFALNLISKERQGKSKIIQINIKQSRPYVNSNTFL